MERIPRRALPADPHREVASGNARHSESRSPGPQNSSRVIDASNASSSVLATVRAPSGVSQMAMPCESCRSWKTTV